MIHKIDFKILFQFNARNFLHPTMIYSILLIRISQKLSISTVYEDFLMLTSLKYVTSDQSKRIY